VEADPTRRAALVTVARPEGADDALWQREIATHAAMITHEATLEAAVADQNANARAAKWFAAEPDSRQWLRAHLRAEPVPDTRLVRIFLAERLATPNDEAAVVEAIANTYIADQRRAAEAASRDRMSALNALKSKYEIRVRELSDKQNNLMLRMQIGQVGTPNVYSTTDLELRDAIARHADLRTALTAATAKRDALKTNPDNAKLADAEADVVAAQAALDASNKRVDALKSVLGDLSIAMSDYHHTQTELAATREELRNVRWQLDRLQSIASIAPVEWARQPLRGEADK
jgi:hypothetical protein